MSENNKSKEQIALSKELLGIAVDYSDAVDKAKGTASTANDIYHEKTGHSLLSKIQETVDNSEYGSQLPSKMKLSKTYELIAYQISAYERYQNNDLSKSTEVWETKSDLSKEQKLHKNVGFALYKTNIIASQFKLLDKKNEHIHNLSKFSEIKFGDVIQIYQPYADGHTKPNTKNNVDRFGQNRFYGIIQKLPNGDFLAVDFRGHRNTSEDSDILKFNPAYAYPSSKNVQPSLDVGDKLLVQLPKEAVAQGTALREKYEAASYGKPFNAMAPLKIRVFEMSPENLNKMKLFKAKINQNGLDIGWAKDQNKVVPASKKGRRMFNEYFNDNVRFELKSGAYDKRNALMTQRINRQAIIRTARYGEDSTAKIQSKSQREHTTTEHRKNYERQHQETIEPSR